MLLQVLTADAFTLFRAYSVGVLKKSQLEKMGILEIQGLLLMWRGLECFELHIDEFQSSEFELTKNNITRTCSMFKNQACKQLQKKKVFLLRKSLFDNLCNFLFL